RLDPVQRRDLAPRHLRTDPAEADATLLQAVDGVAAAEPALRDRLDREEHRPVDLLRRARQDVRAEEGLVGVDPDPPDLLLARGLERTEAASARDLEDGDRAGGDLVERDHLALR